MRLILYVPLSNLVLVACLFQNRPERDQVYVSFLELFQALWNMPVLVVVGSDNQIKLTNCYPYGEAITE